MTISQGNYSVTIHKDAAGIYFLKMTHGMHSVCIPGVSTKEYKTAPNAERAAKKILAKIA